MRGRRAYLDGDEVVDCFVLLASFSSFGPSKGTQPTRISSSSSCESLSSASSSISKSDAER